MRVILNFRGDGGSAGKVRPLVAGSGERATWDESAYGRVPRSWESNHVRRRNPHRHPQSTSLEVAEGGGSPEQRGKKCSRKWLSDGGIHQEVFSRQGVNAPICFWARSPRPFQDRRSESQPAGVHRRARRGARGMPHGGAVGGVPRRFGFRAHGVGLAGRARQNKLPARRQ